MFHRFPAGAPRAAFLASTLAAAWPGLALAANAADNLAAKRQALQICVQTELRAGGAANFGHLTYVCSNDYYGLITACQQADTATGADACKASAAALIAAQTRPAPPKP